MRVSGQQEKNKSKGTSPIENLLIHLECQSLVSAKKKKKTDFPFFCKVFQTLILYGPETFSSTTNNNFIL